MAGRKSKLTTQVHDTIINYISAGATDKDAYTSVGISYDCFYRWLREGEAAKSGQKREFYEAVTRARAQAFANAAVALRSGMVASQTVVDTTDTIIETRIGKDGQPYQYRKVTTRKSVTKHPSDWRAAVEFLKRRDPEHWGDKIGVDDWHTQAIKDIRNGLIDFEDIDELLGHDLATDLFKAAGVSVQT